MTITHTRVPQAIGGRGIAAELMRETVKVAGERGWSINPACSYAAAYMRKHAQAPDKRHIDELLDEALDESFPAIGLDKTCGDLQKRRFPGAVAPDKA